MIRYRIIRKGQNYFIQSRPGWWPFWGTWEDSYFFLEDAIDAAKRYMRTQTLEVMVDLTTARTPLDKPEMGHVTERTRRSLGGVNALPKTGLWQQIDGTMRWSKSTIKEPIVEQITVEQMLAKPEMAARR